MNAIIPVHEETMFMPVMQMEAMTHDDYAMLFMPIPEMMELCHRFNQNAIPAEGEQCWNWRLSKQKAGYGQVVIKRQLFLAHRLSYTVHHGPIPDGLEVCHECDNPGCCNPDHLFLGTHAQNLADMGKKGRSPRGTKHWNARLTEVQISEIRSLAQQGISYTAIGQRFGISRHHASKLARGKAWKHVE